jgi:sigma-B regulation protein RsbU (phosphoserine phosphatase)
MPDVFVTRWMLQIASLVQVILLSLALADKIKYMTEKMGVLNESLETKVQERTQELNSTLMSMKKKDTEVQKEFHLAGDIQQGILPKTPFYIEGIRIVAYYKSMGPVGGDFYDIFQMKGGYVGIVVADASGHGMPAAFITALAKISFAEAIQTSLFPADIFRHVNNDLIKAIKTDDFVTAFFVVISPTYDVFYSNASHQMAMVLRKDSLSIEKWDTNGLFMGYSKDANGMYEDGQNKLNYGDRLVLYTDGIPGITNIKGESFGENRLERLLIETAELQLEEARDRIIEECLEFAEGTQQPDDMTLVVIEIDPAYRELIEYREQGFKLMWRQHYGDAIGLLEKALAINEADEKSHLFLGECYIKNGDYGKAVLHLQRYLVNNEFDANVWYNLAWAYYCLDEYADTLKYATRASSLKGNFIDALMLCALSMKKMRDVNGARKMFEKILALDPDNEMAEKELKEISHE